MGPARTILGIFLIAVLVVYSLDCFAASTPDDAMQCCDSMPCPEHSHNSSEDCCQTMPSLQGPFLHSKFVDTPFHPMTPVAVLAVLCGPQTLFPPSHVILGKGCHAPPGSQVPALSPLRI